MSSMLSGTSHIHHRTPLPAGTTVEDAMRVFRDFESLIRLDSDMIRFKETTSDQEKPNGETRYFEVTDKVANVPKILGSEITYTSELSLLENGILWVIHGPMGMTQTSNWTIEKAKANDESGAEEGSLLLVEDGDVKCNRLLLSFVVSKSDANWKSNHQKWISYLGKGDN